MPNFMYIEFSFPIDPKKPVANQGIRSPQVIPRTRMAAGDKSNTSYLEMYAHTGTHIDSPWHFNDAGFRIHDFSIDQFVFEKVFCVTIPRQPWQEVGLQDLEPYREKIRSSDALFINTSFAAKYREKDVTQYLTATPGLSLDAARMLAEMPLLRCIGVDFTSVENLQNNRPLGYPVHHALLDGQKPMLLLEDANLELLASRKIIRIFLFPLRVIDLEASPVTAVAEI
jgi:arylformamidase